jgi:hypothetical protein
LPRTQQLLPLRRTLSVATVRKEDILLGEKDGPNIGSSLLWNVNNATTTGRCLHNNLGQGGESSVRMFEGARQVGLGYSKCKRIRLLQVKEESEAAKDKVDPQTVVTGSFLTDTARNIRGSRKGHNSPGGTNKVSMQLLFLFSLLIFLFS